MELTIEMKARRGKVQELYQTLQALLPTMRREGGCRACRVYRDAEGGEVFFLMGDWEAQAHLDQYLRSRNGRALLGAIDLLSETARARCGQDEPWTGIDTLKGLRKKP